MSTIGWTHIMDGFDGATWNPMKAINTLTNKPGYFCIPHGPGCLFCYARRINVSSPIGNGLDYKASSLHNARLYISGEHTENKGQTSIEWPLRSKKSQGIFPVSMSDWCGEFQEMESTMLLLGTMMLAQHHIFMTLTKRESRLHDLIRELTDPKVQGIGVLNGKVWDIAVLKARGNQHKWNTKMWLKVGNQKGAAAVPWPPKNIFFGVTIVNEQEARNKLRAIMQLREQLPTIRLMVSYEPALEPIDWKGIGYDGLLDWLIVGGESGDPDKEDIREMPEECITSTIAFGKDTGVPVYVKQTGTVLARQLKLHDPKGQNVPEKWMVREFPVIEGSYIPWNK